MEKYHSDLLSLHVALLKFQRHMRHSRWAQNSVYSPVVTNYFPILYPHLPLSFAQFVDFIKSEKTESLSIVDELRQSGALKIVPADKPISNDSIITSNFDDQFIIEEILLEDASIINNSFKFLHKDEIVRVTNIFAQFNDAIAIFPEKNLKTEIVFTGEQKNLARNLGMLGKYYLQGDFSVNEIHFFEEIMLRNNQAAFEALFAAVPCTESELLGIIKNFQEKNLLQDLTGKEYQNTIFSLTNKGSQVALEAREHCLIFLKQLVKAITTTDLDFFIGLSRRLATNRS